MLRTGIRFVCLAVLSGALALASASPVLAGGGGGKGGGGGGGWGGGGHGWGGGGGGWGGYGRGWDGYYGRGWGGYYSYPYYRYNYYPYYYDTYPSYNYPYTYGYYGNSDQSSDTGQVAKVTVLVPKDAEVTFNDKVSPTGYAKRWLETPTLRGEREFPVKIHAQWSEGGATVERSRTVVLHPGEDMKIDFMGQNNQPTSNSPSTTDKLPQPQGK